MRASVVRRTTCLENLQNTIPKKTAISGAFVAAFNSYVREDLKFGTELKLIKWPLTSNGQNWDWKHQGADQYGFPRLRPNVEADLIGAMLANPHLKIEVEKRHLWTWQLLFWQRNRPWTIWGLAPDLRKNIKLQYYEAGHMMYVRNEDLAKLEEQRGCVLSTLATKP